MVSKRARMRKKNFLLIGLLLVCSCSHSGRLVEKQLSGSPGTVPYRAGTVPYRNDSRAVARRNDALRKIAKFCGSDGYTITREGTSASGPNTSEVEFQCGEGPGASASGGSLAQPNSSATPGGTHITANPNVEPPPSDFDRP
jgi:hypothetical protein